MRLGRMLATALCAGAWLIAVAAPASAHADIAAASPAPGTSLPQAPGFVQIEFTEPLNRAASNIRVLDDRGVEHGVGSTTAAPGDARALRRALGFLRPGLYTVAWTSTSALDGHTRQGSYKFGIGASAPDTQRVRESPVDSEGGVGIA